MWLWFGGMAYSTEGSAGIQILKKYQHLVTIVSNNVDNVDNDDNVDNVENVHSMNFILLTLLKLLTLLALLTSEII